MNIIELDALNKALSNEARSLYCIGLRPNIDEQSGILSVINYKQLMTLLNSKDEKFTLGRQINSLLKELQKVGLIEFEQTDALLKSVNGNSVKLPYAQAILSSNTATVDFEDLHARYIPMDISWTPEPALFEQIVQLVGMIDNQYNKDDLGEFIAYWLGRPTQQFTLYQWTQKFVLHLKKRRLFTKDSTQSTKVGQQWVTLSAGLEADDNAKQLVEKYNKKEK